MKYKNTVSILSFFMILASGLACAKNPAKPVVIAKAKKQPLIKKISKVPASKILVTKRALVKQPKKVIIKQKIKQKPAAIKKIALKKVQPKKAAPAIKTIKKTIPKKQAPLKTTAMRKTYTFVGAQGQPVRITVLLDADITKQTQIDALVNAANVTLLGGGGIDGAIHKAAGPELKKYCQTMPVNSVKERCPVGGARITPAFNIAQKDGYKCIIHTVGPKGTTKNRAQLLADAYYNSALLAAQNGMKSIVFPTISTGIYKYPMVEATDIAVKTLVQFLQSPENQTLNHIVLIVWGKEHYALYLKSLDQQIS